MRFRAAFIEALCSFSFIVIAWMNDWNHKTRTGLGWHEIVYIILFWGWTVTLMLWFIHAVRPSVLTKEMWCSADYFESLVRCLLWLHLLLFLIRSCIIFQGFERPWRSHSTETSKIKSELLAHQKQKPCVPQMSHICSGVGCGKVDPSSGTNTHYRGQGDCCMARHAKVPMTVLMEVFRPSAAGQTNASGRRLSAWQRQTENKSTKKSAGPEAMSLSRDGQVHLRILLKRNRALHWCIALEIKLMCAPKNYNSVIYSPSGWSKPVWVSFSCWTQNKLF